jgi:hypothetical protein
VNQKKIPPPSKRSLKSVDFPAYPLSPPATEAQLPSAPDDFPAIDEVEPEPTEGESAEALGLSEADYHAEVSDEEQQRHPLLPDDSNS